MSSIWNNRYKLDLEGGELGSGTFGDVFKALDLNTNK